MEVAAVVTAADSVVDSVAAAEVLAEVASAAAEASLVASAAVEPSHLRVASAAEPSPVAGLPVAASLGAVHLPVAVSAAEPSPVAGSLDALLLRGAGSVAEMRFSGPAFVMASGAEDLGGDFQLASAFTTMAMDGMAMDTAAMAAAVT
jgi:hypothetical protein